jgi:spore maturation protein CgeB
MKIVIFGLTITSSWGNGHATLWRGLCNALFRRGHHILFFEHDVSYYAETRDLESAPFTDIFLYKDWDDIRSTAEAHLSSADVTIVTSYSPDALRATELAIQSKSPLRVFYDLDTPITLSRHSARENVGYIGPRGLRDFDLVLSFTGGPALEALQTILGAKKVATLFGHVDPEIHGPTSGRDAYAADLSYFGTFAEDRQKSLQTLFMQPAYHLSDRRFLIAGALYPKDFPWAQNIWFVPHLPPNEHSQFFCSSRLTLNVTRKPMAEMGFCPSGRLFEAASCGTPIISDSWKGIELFFRPGSEILIAQTREDVVRALQRPDQELKTIGKAARERVLKEHTSAHRAIELEELLMRGVCHVGNYSSRRGRK